MKFILSLSSVTAAIWLLALGEFVRAQDGQQRSPIPEFPPAEDVADEGNESQPADGGRSVGELRGVDGDPVEMSDTLFLPAESGADPAGAGLPDSAPDGPIDEATMGMAAVAPKDDQLQLMQLYEGLRQFDNAIAAAELVLKRDPNNKEALAGMARLMIETGRSHQALRLCDKLQKLDPGVDSQGLMASALISAARYEEAELILQQMKAAHRVCSTVPI